MSTQAQFAKTPHAATVNIATANTNRDGTGTLGTVFTAGANGSRIDGLVVQATGTTTAGMVRLYIDDGSNKRLVMEIQVDAITVGASTKAFHKVVCSAQDPELPLILQSGYLLKASTHNAESFNVAVINGGDL